MRCEFINDEVVVIPESSFEYTYLQKNKNRTFKVDLSKHPYFGKEDFYKTHREIKPGLWINNMCGYIDEVSQ